MDFLPCASCYKQALIFFSPDKSFVEEDVDDTSDPSERLFRLPFEVDDDDKLGPWDILLSEDAIKDMRQLEPRVINDVSKKLWQISSGSWEKHGLLRTVQTHAIPVYEIEHLDHNGLKILILWQGDYGICVCQNSLTE